MPELPEVETTRRALLPALIGQKVHSMIIRQPSLRWPVTPNLPDTIAAQVLRTLTRRGKYLLFKFEQGTLIVHLGMSGSLALITADDTAQLRPHDHIDIWFETGVGMRYHDPRRFGSMHWSREPDQHWLLCHLGVEPLTTAFSGIYLFEKTRGKKRAIKILVMDHKIVVGVGNIYANEALFYVGLHPERPADTLTLQHCQQLVKIIKRILRKAVLQGGTTLRDFTSGHHQIGYFQQSLAVYGRENSACKKCGATLLGKKVAQRQTVWCPSCQKEFSNKVV